MNEEIKEEVAEPQVEQEAPEQEIVEEEKPQSREDENLINWKKANEVLKFQKMRIDELENQLQQREIPRQPDEEPDEFEQLPQDDYLTVQQARKMAEKMAEKKAKMAVKSEIEAFESRNRVAQDEARCQTKYEDYAYVMENFALPMIKNDPALAYKIQMSKNPAETAYKLGKLTDAYEETMTKQSSPSPRAEKVLKNAQRPTSSNAAGTLKAQSEHYSKMSKDQIWAESQKYARQA